MPKSAVDRHRSGGSNLSCLGEPNRAGCPSDERPICNLSPNAGMPGSGDRPWANLRTFNECLPLAEPTRRKAVAVLCRSVGVPISRWST